MTRWLDYPDLSVRACNVLHYWAELRGGPLSLVALSMHTSYDVLRQPRAGRTTLAEIEALLARHGLQLADRTDALPADAAAQLSSEVWP